MSIYDTLNPEQRRAVEHDKGPLLILAGAGSGKTRVLTHRIAYLIDERDVNPYNILALTFTNKAAKEMRERVDKIVGYGSENIWVSTFHSTCVRFLRKWIECLGYERSFTIYDTDDQRSLMRDICKALEIDTQKMKERSFLSVISKCKDELVTPEEYELQAFKDPLKTKYAQVYKEYQRRLKANNALDFDDIICKTVELFQTNKEALEYYQNRFKYIMVDEYQDTNSAQFKLISLLASTRNEDGEIEHNLCVVGDDDQSIYKFRGANIRNILDFEQEYPDTEVIKLEQNYRSTKSILNAANGVIANNLGRKSKALWTDNPEGDPVQFNQYDNDYQEADAITNSIKDVMSEYGANFNDFAILYRTNAQSRVLEEKLIQKNIPYKIIGSVNFYQRKEIKDLLAYLKTIDNGLDGVAVKRIINVPKRGIGLTTIDRVEDHAIHNNMSFYNALCHVESIPGTGRAAAKITSFVSLIESLKSKLSNKDYSLKDLLTEIIEATGYVKELEAADEEEAKERIGNIDELINKIASYEENCEDIPSLSGFLEEVALIADIDNMDQEKDVVILMTLHSAKGLEFPYVYMCGVEEGIFPSYMSINAENPEAEIEEERRLCYVGITRAMKELYISAARQRMMRGETQYNRPSRFISEIPRHLISFGTNTGKAGFLAGNAYGKSPIRNASPYASSNSSFGTSSFKSTSGMKPIGNGGFKSRINEDSLDFEKSAPSFNSYKAPNPYQAYSASAPKQFGNANLGELPYGVGDSVKHIKFGVGVVTNITKGGRDYEVTVDFPGQGTKKMLSTFAKLVKVD